MVEEFDKHRCAIIIIMVEEFDKHRCAIIIILHSLLSTSCLVNGPAKFHLSKVCSHLCWSSNGTCDDFIYNVLYSLMS